MARRNRLAAFQHHGKESLEDFLIAMLVGIQKIGLARSRLKSRKGGLPPTVFQSAAYLPPTVDLRQLAEAHQHHMNPTVE